HSKALFGRRLPVGKDLYLRFYRSGHLLGATSVGVVWGPDPKLGSARPQRTINFSGDLGPNLEDREQLPFLRHMMKPTPGDYAVVESTYGGSVRPLEDGDAEIRISRLNVALREGLARGGPVIIPAFAMGRTQDLLFDLHLLFARHPHFNGVPVHLDGAMALKASKITATSIGRLHSVSGNRQKLAWLGKQVFKLFGLKLDDADDEAILVDALKEMLHPGHVPEQPRTGPFERWRRIYQVVDPKKRASISGPCIILTGGGMCNGGPVQEYLKQHLREPEATVLLTGYCSVGTVGQELAHLGRLPPEEWRRLNERLGLDDVSIRKREVEATIQVMSGYSAHADQRGLLEWLFYRMPGDEYWSSAGKHVFVTHGNPTARRQLAVATEHRARMLDIDVEANLPGSDRWFDLDEDRWVEEEMSELEMLRARYEELERKSSKMEEGNLCAV
ncbi:MAG: hypothetical protein KAI66_27485, partial [Lentisphaeria bacterium]|nr:hypothetical protein [Lentisphaeria bacterium]